jgi:hypothetical protein
VFPAVIPLSAAVGLLMIGAVIALLGETWAGLDSDAQLRVAGLTFVGGLLLLGLDPIRDWMRRRKTD